ncbi:calcium-binding and coiled-coil domain-containing protein 2 isoform X2 [Tachysurus fulvidraco]|uniref:calcium-binding and coiled-coil domain-containing protein 2 isoform X2 n=1 Tax=Tachysurus fulvidraco TaxID=1234273 RepID=UPI001FEDF124|nr:calcium-binding and coiled-coil domain-containing protein 2 isoform X2 [Tachysurus fulvidraco]
MGTKTKVGWDSAMKYYCYEWTKPYLDCEGFEQKIVFTKSYLPTDDGEFYQFCYVDSNRQVRGASTPFSFQNPSETSVDCSLLVISTQEQVEQMEKEKEALLSEIEDLKEGKTILKQELDERLKEICRLRLEIEKLKSNSRSETLSLTEQPECPQQDTSEQPFLSDTVAENKPEQESLTLVPEKYERAFRKITILKQEKVHLEQQLKEKDAVISELRPKAKKTEQDYNRLQDLFQLQQVDMQNIQKDNDMLYLKIDGLKWDLEKLREENKATLPKQEPPEEDKNDTKTQILTLTNELREVRGTLRKEIQNSAEANKRADKAELELKELKVQLEKRTVAEESQIEMDIAEACRRNSEQASMAEVARLEKEKLLEENKKLNEEIERLQMMMTYELSSGVNVSNTQQHEDPFNPVPVSPINTQQQPQSESFLYEDIRGPFGNPTNTGNKEMMCRHCHESFPDITEHELVTHEQSHKVCPFCTLICDDCGQQEFEDHVYSHEE